MADDSDDNVLSFRPRPDGPVPPPPLPPLFAGPPTADDPGSDEPARLGSMPSLPGVKDMGVPLALMMPPLPSVAADDPASGEDEEGAFAPPAPEDPNHPTARDTLAVCLALVTAMGVAAAQGMWHRARQRQARADQARALADKATAKAAGTKAASGGGASGGGGSKASSLKSPGRTRLGGGRKGDRDRPAGHGKGPRGPRKDPGRGKGTRGTKAPKAGRDGKRERGRDKRRRKSGRDKEPFKLWKRRGANRKSPKQPDVKTPKGGADKSTSKTPKTPKKPGKLRWKAPKRGAGKGGAKDLKGWTSGRPGGSKKKPKRKRPASPRVDKMTWKAPKRRPGGGKASTGRKRWKRRTGPGGKGAPHVKRRRKSWVRRAWKGRPRWVKRWRRSHARAAGAGRSWPRWSWNAPKQGSRARARDWAAGRHRANGARASSSAGASAGPPPPPPGWEGMRPPPGADRTVRVENVERVDNQPQSAPEPLVLAGAPAGGRPALPAGSAPTSAPAQTNGAFVSTPRTTQYRDAELTIYDVIDADADMAEEILAGVDEARATADGCEQLFTRLESVHAKIEELKVPGLLAGWMVRLKEKTATVKARAEAIAAHLPAASEAISVAGSNAAARHQHLADVTRDMGHTRPAERPYHDE